MLIGGIDEDHARSWMQADIQNRSQVSLYLQSSPYLVIMHNSHLQTEICIEGAFKKSKIISDRALMIIMIIVIAKKSFGDVIKIPNRFFCFFRNCYVLRNLIGMSDIQL